MFSFSSKINKNNKCNMYINNEIAWCTFGVFISIFLRLCTTLHPYSGQSKPPMYGDYEAQRHWMEITVNLPMNQWYHNTTSNDLNYWGLDYPPLTAYHSYLNGLLAWLVNPSFVELGASRGYESQQHKLFMRYTVLLSDIIIYIPAIVIYYLLVAKVINKKKKSRIFTLQSSITLALLYPGIILIDHGHFQYNCISLGFTIFAIAALTIQWDLIGSILFVLAVNYKQMELYHAFPFFLYLLSSCIPKPGASALSGVVKLTKLALTVIITFAILWLPFLFKMDNTLQVIHRLFPIVRGIFEDKVANVWCTLNIFYKLKTYCASDMVRYCTIATLAALLPSSANLFLGPNIKKLVPALINSSLAFFLFSFQVHEKSILLAAIPALLYLPEKPLQCFWFLYISNFSMLPLFVKDKLVVAYFALTVFYVTAFIYCHERCGFSGKFEATFGKFIADVRKILAEQLTATKTDAESSFWQVIKIGCNLFVNDTRILKELLTYATLFVSMVGSIMLTLVALIYEPPKQYPDLYTLIISVFCCLHFIGFLVYFNIVQFRIPQRFEPVQMVSASSFSKTKVKQS